MNCANAKCPKSAVLPYNSQSLKHNQHSCIYSKNILHIVISIYLIECFLVHVFISICKCCYCL